MDFSTLDFTLRRASATDAENIFAWRNNEWTRAMSLNSDSIEWENHKFWYENTLNSANNFLLIGELDKHSIGLVRFTVYQPGKVLASINLNPDFRGKGLGKLLLGESLKWLQHQHGEIGQIVAEIKSENLASISIFASCGFELDKEKTSGSVGIYIKGVGP